MKDPRKQTHTHSNIDLVPYCKAAIPVKDPMRPYRKNMGKRMCGVCMMGVWNAIARPQDHQISPERKSSTTHLVDMIADWRLEDIWLKDLMLSVDGIYEIGKVKWWSERDVKEAKSRICWGSSNVERASSSRASHDGPSQLWYGPLVPRRWWNCYWLQISLRNDPRKHSNCETTTWSCIQTFTFYIGPDSVFQVIPEIFIRNLGSFKDLQTRIWKKKDEVFIECGKILLFPNPDYASLSRRISDGWNKVSFRRNDTWVRVVPHSHASTTTSCLFYRFHAYVGCNTTAQSDEEEDEGCCWVMIMIYFGPDQHVGRERRCAVWVFGRNLLSWSHVGARGELRLPLCITDV